MKKIILCATQRSGSTMVCDDLRGTKVLGIPEEYFIPWVQEYKENSYDWKSELEKIFTLSSCSNGVSSVKIMADQIEGISSKVQTYLKNDKLDALASIPIAFGECIWVRIVRKNSIKQAISRYLATQTGVCHASDNKDSFFAEKTINYDATYNENVEFDYNAILEDICSIRNEEIKWNNFFIKNKIIPFEIVYEEIVDDPSCYLSCIAELLGINGNTLTREPRKIKKLSNGVNEKWYIKFLELSQQDLFVHGPL